MCVRAGILAFPEESFGCFVGKACAEGSGLGGIGAPRGAGDAAHGEGGVSSTLCSLRRVSLSVVDWCGWDGMMWRAWRRVAGQAGFDQPKVG